MAGDANLISIQASLSCHSQKPTRHCFGSTESSHAVRLLATYHTAARKLTPVSYPRVRVRGVRTPGRLLSELHTGGTRLPRQTPGEQFALRKDGRATDGHKLPRTKTGSAPSGPCFIRVGSVAQPVLFEPFAFSGQRLRTSGNKDQARGRRPVRGQRSRGRLRSARRASRVRW